MSVLELQPQYELQVYKLLLGAAALAGEGAKQGGKAEEAGRLRIGTHAERADPFHHALGFSSVPSFTPKPFYFPCVCLLLKIFVFFQKDVRWDSEGGTGLCYHSM